MARPVPAALTPENEAFVRTSGKWTAFDVSAVPPYSTLVSGVVAGVQPMTAAGKIVGVRLVTESATLTVHVDDDETTCHTASA